MNLVTLTMHSPSHASARFDAKAMEKNSRTTDGIGIGEVRGGRDKKVEREGGVSFSLSSSSTHFRTTKVRPTAITGSSLVLSYKVKVEIDDRDW